MKNCKTCGQKIPTPEFRPGDIVWSLLTKNYGIVTQDGAFTKQYGVLTKQYGVLLAGWTRFVAVETGSSYSQRSANLVRATGTFRRKP